jgi:toxin-antitoxin system PIN domain toxin
MILPDVNVLVNAYREDSPSHEGCKRWLENAVRSGQAFALSELVLSGFLRIVTHPSVFFPPSPLNDALKFVEALRGRPNAVVLSPGQRHWEIFKGLCQESNAKGNLIPDAYLAAMAIEAGAEWVTMDRDFSRFPGLKIRHPLKAA